MPRDPDRAWDLLVRAWELGAESAACELGQMCLKGDGVPQNDQEAVRWWTLGAQKGDSTAQYDLGWCCEKGRGIGQDYAQAAYWYPPLCGRRGQRCYVQPGLAL